MAHHLIFIDNSVGLGRSKEEVFKQVELEDHIGGCTAMQLAPEESPSGEGGFLYAWTSKGDDQIIVVKEKQTWKKSHLGYWVGVWNDKLPTESQLRRPYMQPGIWIPGLIDGQAWKMPTPDTLNPRMALDDDGTWKFVPMREYAWYTEEIQKRRAEMEVVEENGETFWRYNVNPIQDICLLIRALRINYRVTPEVCDIAGMFTRDSVNAAYKQMLGFGGE